MTDVRSPYFTRTKNKNIAVKRELKDSAVHSKKTINNKRIKTAVKLEPEKEIVVKREPGTKWEPRNWLAQLENIREMRKEKNAPVDTMGCEKCKGENYTEKVNVTEFGNLVVWSLRKPSHVWLYKHMWG